jgi:predicted glycosyltransferase
VKVLIDIMHPAHVHFFRNFRKEMIELGHEIIITAREKDVAVDLLDEYGITYQVLSKQGRGVKLAVELLQRTWRLVEVVRAEKPDVMVGISGPCITLAGPLTGTPAVVFYDTEFAWQTNWFTYPLAHSVCTPDCYQGKVRGNHVTYAGYHELAYLHPRRFEPDPARVRTFGLEADEPYSLLRFVSWEAVHDVNEKGLTLSQKGELIEELSSHGRVVISSEADLPEEFESFQLRGPVSDIHHVLAHAEMIIGESATMASEAAVLGVPAVFIATTGRGYTDDQQKRYGLVDYFTEDRFDEAITAIKARFAAGSPRALSVAARNQLLTEKIDVTHWMVDYIGKLL